MVTYPKDWTEECLEDITASIITGGTPSTTNPSFWGGTIPWLASAEIHQKKITRPTTYITDIGLQNSSAKVAPKNSVLVALAGQGKTRGTVAILQNDMAINQSLAALVVNEKADAEFLFHAMETSYNSLREISSGDGGRGGLNKKLLKKYAIVLPKDILEQEVIAETLSCIDTHIDNLTELIEKKKAIRDGALEDLVSGRTRLDGFAKPWKQTTLGKEYNVIMGQSPNSSSYNFSKVGIPLVQGNADIENRVTSPQRYTTMPTKVCDIGDTIITVRAPVGTVSKANQMVCLGRGVCAINGMNKDFIFYMMRYYESAWESIEQGSTFTAVSGKEVRNFEIMIPEDDEQLAIASILTSMDTEIASFEEEKDKMLQIKAGAMDDLLTGRVRLQVKEVNHVS